MNKLLALGVFAAVLATPFAAAARPMTATDLATLRRIGAPTVSPDGRWLVYTLRETDLAANRGRNDLWVIDLRNPENDPSRLASTSAFNEHDPHFGPDGALYFISNQSGSDQLWRIARAGRADAAGQ